MAATMNAATFMGKNFSTVQNFIMNSEDLTLKQMFDIIAKLVSDQDEIRGLDKIHWGKNSWKRLSLIGDETVINLQSTKVCVFSDSVLCLGGSFNILIPTKFGRTLQGSRPRKATETMTVSMESRLNSSGTSSQDSQRCSSGQTPETFTGRVLFVSMFNDIFCDRKGNKDECFAGHMHLVVIHVHVRLSLSSPLSLSAPTCPSLSSSFPSLSCTASCTLSSTT